MLFRTLCSLVVVLLFVVSGIPAEEAVVGAGASAATGTGGTRNTEWLEETIDQFLQQAENNGEPTDIQVSTCKISNQQLVATAQATIARALKGYCNPNEIEDKLHNLEVQLGDQLNVIKTMILGVENKIVAQDHEFKRLVNQIQQQHSASTYARRRSFSTNPIPHTTTTSVPYIASDDESDSYDNENGDASGSMLSQSPRYQEMSKFNSTIHTENGRRVFSYYWLVTGMNYKLSHWGHRRYLRSNSFYISPGSYRMYLKIIPRFAQNTMYIHTGITKGDFDDGISWPFTNKLRISVLSHRDSGGYQDLKSRIWDPVVLCSGSNWIKPVTTDNPECLGLGFPHEVIQNTGFIQNDQMVIKLTVYLD